MSLELTLHELDVLLSSYPVLNIWLKIAGHCGDPGVRGRTKAWTTMVYGVQRAGIRPQAGGRRGEEGNAMASVGSATAAQFSTSLEWRTTPSYHLRFCRSEFCAREAQPSAQGLGRLHLEFRWSSELTEAVAEVRPCGCLREVPGFGWLLASGSSKLRSLHSSLRPARGKVCSSRAHLIGSGLLDIIFLLIN